MDSGGAGMSTSSVPHQLVYLCIYTTSHNRSPTTGVLLTMHKMKMIWYRLIAAVNEEEVIER